jgi:DNA-binding NarL/FixJ family response regulator
MFARIRQRLPRLPIVLASGFDEPQLAESAQEWGAEGFIHKPFSITVLARVIRKVLDERITAQREEST